MADETRGAGEWNIIIEQGETWQRTITLTDSAGAAVDLSSYTTARMDIRKKKESSTAEIELTQATEISLTNAATGIITLTLTPAQTAALNFDTGYYDLELATAAGAVLKYLYGTVTLEKEVTR